MKCNCSIGNIVLGLIILILTLWPNLLDIYTRWVVIAAAVLLIVHELWHNHSWSDKVSMNVLPSKPSRKRR
ncbi:MAG: hypothetical protein QXI33_02710 [Candidatus Pacearchaeota archaeon]